MNIVNSQKLIVVLGPTASGKTSLAYKLCKDFDGFIISADSRQVYRYMDLGTGKVDTLEELADLHKSREKQLEKNHNDVLNYIINIKGINNYLIDIIEPTGNYNVALYQKDVFKIMRQIKNNANFGIPFLVGGTGLYIKAVVENLHFPGNKPDKKLRSQIAKQIKNKGLDFVWQRLIRLDPECEKIVQRKNPRRVIRALEYNLATGQKFSQARKKGPKLFNVLKIGIRQPRKEIYKKIDLRVDQRIKLGMIQEIQTLMDKHYVSYKKLQSFGLEYRVISQFLNNEFKSQKEMAQHLKWDIHSFARRQLTWFKKDKDINWIQDYSSAKKLIDHFLK